jgi:hypothetical protein
MDIEIVNAILQLCTDLQTCLFEVPFLCDYCLEQKLCTNSKYVLASIKNYMEIFKISRDQNRIEFYMPVCIHCFFVFHFVIFFIIINSLKYVEIIFLMVFVKIMEKYAQISMYVMIISIQIHVVVRSVVHIHIN